MKIEYICPVKCVEEEEYSWKTLQRRDGRCESRGKREEGRFGAARVKTSKPGRVLPLQRQSVRSNPGIQVVPRYVFAALSMRSERFFISP